ncbi:MAG: chromosomal replication initiator DnaA [Rhodospirillales bacterium]|nr:chromosomal replication initiator DnaA [Rhodospirillales bacterium]
MTPLARQLMLPFPHAPGFAAADFLVAPSNEAAMAWIARPREWPEHRLLLWGQAGCGKTHLLHLWADRVAGTLLTGPTLRGLPMLPEAGDIAVDDADLVAEEAALFHLLNAAREAGRSVLLSARTPPARWAIGLPDLASRLRAVTAIEIMPPEESLLRALLARLLADRQLAVPAALQDWLLLRLPRTPAALREAVARLDAAGSRIDRALAADVVAGLAQPEEA